jgi:PPK2 family polyphosphate:nucleotide phosphotransferase
MAVTLPKAVLDQLKISPGERFRIRDHDPKWLPPGLRDLSKQDRRARAAALLESSRSELAEAQDRLYADDRFALLLVFQAMDAAGKDSTIKHVMTGINPQGCEVTSFKVPSDEELSHTFLWRCAKAVPQRGRIGIFNRSYYEDVLVVKVHPEILDGQGVSPRRRGRAFWGQRYEDINAFEKHLSANGTTIIKFFLNVSRDEQRQRFLDRIDDPSKNWKFSSSDLKERARWDDYMKAFEEAINATSTPHAPWYVIPADRKWAMRAAVADIVTTTLTAMKVTYPRLEDEQLAGLEQARAELEAEGE